MKTRKFKLSVANYASIDTYYLLNFVLRRQRGKYLGMAMLACLPKSHVEYEAVLEFRGNSSGG